MLRTEEQKRKRGRINSGGTDGEKEDSEKGGRGEQIERNEWQGGKKNGAKDDT